MYRPDCGNKKFDRLGRSTHAANIFYLQKVGSCCSPAKRLGKHGLVVSRTWFVNQTFTSGGVKSTENLNNAGWAVKSLNSLRTF